MRSARRRWLELLGAAALGCAQLAGCGFPDFIVVPKGAGAVAGASGQSPSATAGTSSGGVSGSQPGTAGSPDQGATSGSGASSSLGGEASSAGAPPVDLGPCGERPRPTHCWNYDKDADETDVDCGGPSCEPCGARDQCASDDDCATGACSAGECATLFKVSYVRGTTDRDVKNFGANITLSYEGAQARLLKDITLRYYFSRNGVAEPILPGGSAMLSPSGTDISGDARWSVVRQLRGDGVTNDAYLEIGFVGGAVLSQGDALQLSPNLTAGDDEDTFNQSTHYSYDAQDAVHETERISVQLQGLRVAGRGPEIDDPPSCFHRGVNLDGAAVEIDGSDWEKSPASILERYIDTVHALKPATDDGRDEMLRAGFLFRDDSFVYSVENGSYALLVYAWSADGGDSGTLSVNGEARDRFHAQSFDGGSPWAALGPYRVEITQGELKLAASGVLRVGGIELRLLDE